MDNKLTEKIGKWLATHKDERDIKEGATYLLQLSGNRILYRNILAKPKQRCSILEYQLQKYYNFRVRKLTHEQVEEMQRQTDKIVNENISLAVNAVEGRKGKREDHDSLPDEIKACYVENLGILQRMRELHLKLRSLSLINSPCPDSERYPFLKEIISLDKKMHANWKKYDQYVPLS